MAPAASRSSRPYDLVVWGATGFTGRLACKYLARRYTGGDGGPSVRWALAGRSEERLQETRATLGLPAGANVGVIVADAADPPSVEAAVAQAKCVLSFAGPFAKVGRPLVDACAAAATDYVDITGEPEFIKGSIEANDARAKDKAGPSVLVHCCGYDSIPFDLAVYEAAQALAAAGGGPATEAECLVGPSAGGVSGGTLASAFGAMDDPKGMSRDLRDLCVGTAAPPAAAPPTSLQVAPRHSAMAGVHTAPSIMAGINSRVVYRSAALLPGTFDPSFTYVESTAARGRAGAIGASVAMGLGAALLFLSPTRWLLKKTVLPAPGEGPSERQRLDGFFNTWALCRDAAGTTALAHMGANRAALGGGDQGADPGYGATSVMATEAALCLALDREECPGLKEAGGGVHTPASGLGSVLSARLRAAGLTLDAGEHTPGAPLPKVRATPADHP